MPMFHYEATDRTGKAVVGSMDAASEGAVRTRLLGMGYQATLVEMVVASPGPAKATKASPSRPASSVQRVSVSVSTRSLTHLYRQLATLLDSSVPITDALVRVRAGASGRQMQAATQDMLDTVNAGRPLSEAMARHPRVFKAGHVGVVQAGEQGGVLGRAFAELAKQTEADWGIQSALRFNWMLLYIRFLVLPTAASVGWLLLRVVPIIQSGTALDSLNSLLGQCALVGLLVLLGVNVLFPLLFKAVKWTPAGAWLEAVVFSLPGLNARRKRIDRVKTLGSLADALDAGVPVSLAWQLAAEAADSPFTRARMLKVRPALLTGATIPDVMAQTGIYDRDILDIARTGEAAGRLPEVLRQALAFQRDEANRIGSVTPVLIGVSVMLVVMVAIGFLIVNIVPGILQSQVTPLLNDAP